MNDAVDIYIYILQSTWLYSVGCVIFVMRLVVKFTAYAAKDCCSVYAVGLFMLCMFSVHKAVTVFSNLYSYKKYVCNKINNTFSGIFYRMYVLAMQHLLF